MHYGSDTGAGHYFEGGVISPAPDMRFGLRFNSVDGILDFDANDYLYYSRSNDEYLFLIGGTAQLALGSGGLQVSNVLTVGDGNFGMSLNGTSPYVAFDSGDFIGYNRAADTFNLNIGNVTKATLDSSGALSTIGFVYPSSDAAFFVGIAGGAPIVNFDSLDYLAFNRTTNTYAFIVGNATRATIDSSGNIVSAGYVSPSSDTNFNMAVAGGLPTLTFDAGDTLSYNRSTNVFSFNIGSAAKATLDNSGNFVAYGALLASADANFGLSIPVANIPRITMDTGGDYISYDRAANKYYFVIGGVNVASIDASGNMRLKGTLTQSVTP